jgi:3-phosphoshikimate 1-carboxyvinyltransferase
MRMKSSPARLRGTVKIPGSKSHTIRGVLLASLAEGTSILRDPLSSADTAAAVQVYGALGAEIEQLDDHWRITGIGGIPKAPGVELDVLNSGTTMSVALGTLSLLADGEVVISGDDSIQRRPAAPLVQALGMLGAEIEDLRGTGCPPYRVAGGLRGGRAELEARNSQYVTSLLLACPLAPEDSVIDVPVLFERPYVQMTLDWLEKLGIEIEYEHLQHYRIPGRQRYNAFDLPVAADFSSATFFLAAGAIGDNEITCTGLDLSDSQSDKVVVDFLREMGAKVTVDGDAVTVAADKLRGCEFDLNDCPDTLPMMSVLACFAEGETRLVNVEQARIKETDRIAVMCAELKKLGADVEERPDGLVIRQSQLHGGEVCGHHDHRVVMSMAVAGAAADGPVVIDTAEAAAVTFPTFRDLFGNVGGVAEDC